MALDGKIGSNPISEGHQDAVSMSYGLSPVQDVILPHKRGHNALSSAEGICSISQQGDLKQKFVDEVGNNEKRHGSLQIKSKITNEVDAMEDANKSLSKKTTKATKLVWTFPTIHLDNDPTPPLLHPNETHSRISGLGGFGGLFPGFFNFQLHHGFPDDALYGGAPTAHGFPFGHTPATASNTSHPVQQRATQSQDLLFTGLIMIGLFVFVTLFWN